MRSPVWGTDTPGAKPEAEDARSESMIVYAKGDSSMEFVANFVVDVVEGGCIGDEATHEKKRNVHNKAMDKVRGEGRTKKRSNETIRTISSGRKTSYSPRFFNVQGCSDR